MYLVLCSTYDSSAHWAYQGLKDLGLEPLELITADHLAYAPFWEHRVGKDGAQVRIGLADGRTVSTPEIRGVVNRLLGAPPDLTRLAASTDREYADAELAALYTSWVHALPNSINRPTPQGLCGSWRHTSEWVLLASQAGLATPPYRQNAKSKPESGYASLAPDGAPITRVIALRERLFGAPTPAEVAESCRRLRAAAQTELLGIEFFATPAGEWTFAFATPYPDLMLGGPPLLEALAEELKRGDIQ